MLSSEERAAIQGRADAATEGPWAVWRDLDDQGFYTVGDEAGVLEPGESTDECNPTARVYVEPDAGFIAHAREDIPKLLTELARIEQALEREGLYNMLRAQKRVGEVTGVNLTLLSNWRAAEVTDTIRTHVFGDNEGKTTP